MPLLMSILRSADPNLFAAEDIANLILTLLSADCGGLDVTHGQAGIGIVAVYIASIIPEIAPIIMDKLLPLGHSVARHLNSPSSQQLYGFAHGLAGIGYFFLLLYMNTNWAWAGEVAGSIAHQLLGSKVISPDGTYMWPKSPDDSTVWTHWCHGSAGVGTFLLSAGHALENEDFRDAGLSTAVGIARHRGFGSLSLCHGFPGDLDFILDVMKTYPSSDFDCYKERVLTTLQATANRVPFNGNSVWLWASEGERNELPLL